MKKIPLFLTITAPLVAAATMAKKVAKLGGDGGVNLSDRPELIAIYGDEAHR